MTLSIWEMMIRRVMRREHVGMNIGLQHGQQPFVGGNQASHHVEERQYKTDDQQCGEDDIVQVVIEHPVHLVVVLGTNASCGQVTGAGTHHTDDDKHTARKGLPDTDDRQRIGRHQVTYHNGVCETTQLAHQGRHDGRQEERPEHVL